MNLDDFTDTHHNGSHELFNVLSVADGARRARLTLLSAWPRCDACRWWLAHSPVGVFGDCALFECHEKEQVHQESRLIVSRTGSGEATIMTAADFGCVQWARKS